MSTPNNTMNKDEIAYSEIFKIIYTYKYMIISLMIIFAVASATYAYFKPNIYKASSTIEISPEKQGAGVGTDDVLTMAMNAGSVNVDTEIIIVNSVSMTERALKYVDLAHHYYTTKRYKQIELYKDSPFKVGMLRGYDITFNLIPIDEKRYRLIVEEANNKPWSYDQVHEYSKEISTDYFHLNVIKTKEMKDESYHFSIIDPLKVGRVVQKNVHVKQETKQANVLSISYTDNVPLRTQEFTNALAREYVARSIERKTKEAELKLSFINEHLKNINDNLKSSALKLEEFKRSSNTVDLSAKGQKIIGQMSTFEIALKKTTIKQKMLNALHKEVKQGKNIESISVDELNENMQQSSLSSSIKQLQDAIVSKKVLRQDYTEMSSSVIKINKTIREIKKIIISSIKNLKQSVENKHIFLEKSIEEQQKLLNTLPSDERVYGELERRFRVNEKMYSYLLEKQAETAIIKASTISQNIVIDKAFLPEVPMEPKRKRIILVGMLLGMILGIILAFLRAALNNKIKDEEDIEYGTSVPLLGPIPKMKKEDTSKIKVFLSSKSAFTEAFRNLRTNLQFMPRESRSHVISITSTIGDEGKSTIATNLGAIISMTKRKTIILNLDMRKPTLHKYFGAPNTKGMSTLLSGNTTLDEVTQHTEYEYLDIITSGPVPPNPSELIEGALIEKILMKLREIYDVIILDTPPIGLVSDARILMPFSDTNIYVVRANYSKKEFLRNVEKLSKEDIKGLGIVLNDVKMESGSYGYGYYEEDKNYKR